MSRDLEKLLGQRGFTPARSDAAALVERIVLGDERAIAAVAGLGALAELEARLDAEDGAAARLVQAIGLVARGGDAAARARLIALAGDPRVRVRRAAIIALGKLASTADLELREDTRRQGTDRRSGDGAVEIELRGGDTRRTGEDRRLEDVAAALLARWDASDVAPEERRALAEALGKVGGDAALAKLRALDAHGDKELARLRDRAVLMADRSAKRGAVSTIAIDRAPPQPLRVRLGCRPNLGELLRDECKALGMAVLDARADGVDVELAGPWSALHRARLWATAGIVVPLAPGEELGARIVRTLTSDGVLGLLRAWTHGPIRWRLDVAQRAVIWRVANEVTKRIPELVNDPSATTWEIQVAGDAMVLVPRRVEDPRFAYRIAEVPAASHGSVAAAIVWLAGVRTGDRVWDPFCGSGVELVECARRGATKLAGTDIDPEAIAAAGANLAAAEVTAPLERGDATKAAPGPVDAIVTNPPLGSRVHVDAAGLLIAALPGFARALAPGGRLAWITPAARKTAPVAEGLGLVLDRAFPVDLGGVRGRLERWTKR